MEDRCVCCGAVIPEGRQVCLICDKKIYGNGTGGAAELKPCPFCGGQAKFICCNEESLQGYYRCENFCCEQSFVMTKEDAGEKWNRRTDNA